LYAGSTRAVHDEQVGRLGALELSAITLARSVYHITGLSL
jgi:hypothetical protein